MIDAAFAKGKNDLYRDYAQLLYELVLRIIGQKLAEMEAMMENRVRREGAAARALAKPTEALTRSARKTLRPR